LKGDVAILGVTVQPVPHESTSSNMPSIYRDRLIKLMRNYT